MDGGASSNDPFVCTGGTINTAPVDGVQYKFHKFLNTGSATFTVQGPHGSPGLTNPPAVVVTLKSSWSVEEVAVQFLVVEEVAVL